MQYFNFNGRIYKEGTPVIGAGSRGLRYGDGVFETLKCINGKPVLAGEHFARLWKGMAALQFALPKYFTPQQLEEELAQLTVKNGHDKNARVRITVFRSEGGLYDPADHYPNYIIQSWPLPESNEALNSNGLVVGIYTEARKTYDSFSSLKHNNYLPYVMAALYAKQQKWNDAVVLNTAGRICDSTIANIFLIKDGLISTPSLQEGCVAGIIRGSLLRALKQQGYETIEKEISREELLAADEVFLTNSIYPIRWVKNTGDTFYTNTGIQKIYTGVLPTIFG